MLVPLNRKTFEELIPAIATGAQYAFFWGKLKDLLSRVLISVVGIFAIILLKIIFFGEGFDGILLSLGLIIGLYWVWGPVLWASRRNFEFRRYGYCGFWQGRVLDVFTSEELVGTEETVNNRGDLVVIENRERCLNLEVGDDSGFSTQLRVPLKRAHRAIDVGDVVEMLVFSNRGDLGRIATTSDIYLPDQNLWVSDYPYLQREAFINISRRLNLQYPPEPEPPAPKPSARKRSPKSSASSNPSPKGNAARRDGDGRSSRDRYYDQRDSKQRDYNQRDYDQRDRDDFFDNPDLGDRNSSDRRNPSDQSRRRSSRRPSNDW